MILSRILPIFSCLALVAPVRAEWKPAGLGGGNVQGFHADGKRFIARCDLGFFRSLDGGDSWSYAADPIHGIALMGLGPDLFSATGEPGDSGGIWRSRDNGESWNKLPVPPSLGSDKIDFKLISKFFVSGRYLFATNGSIIFRSGDQGDTWTKSIVSGSDVNDLECLARSGSHLYSGTREGILRSADSGATWIHAGTFPVSMNYSVQSLVGDDSVLVGQAYGKYFRSADSGATWTQIAGMPATDGDPVLLHARSRFYGAVADSIYRSGDGGLTWTLIGRIGNDVTNLSADGDVLYAGTHSGGIFRSIDGGETWIGLNIPGGHVTSLNSYGGRIFASQSDNPSLFRTSDGGKNWTTSLSWDAVHPYPYPPSQGFNLVGSGDRLLAINSPNGQVKRSDDGGTTWETVSGAVFGGFKKAGDRLFATKASIFSSLQQDVYRSDDMGNDWVPLSQDIKHNDKLVAIGSMLLRAGTARTLFRSKDSGATWSATLENLAIYALGAAGNDAFAATDSGLFRSADTGETWERLQPPFKNIQVLCGYGPVLFAGRTPEPFSMPNGPSMNSTVLSSTDRGETWTPVDEGLISTMITHLTVSGPDLWAGTLGAGVWRRPLSELAPGVVAGVRLRRAGKGPGGNGKAAGTGLESRLPRRAASEFDAAGRRAIRGGKGKAVQGAYFVP